MTDTFLDQAPFLSDKSDVNVYANSVLSGRPYRPDDDESLEKIGESSKRNGDATKDVERGGIGVELAKLNHGIEDITRQLRQEITLSYPLLLAHLTTSLSLSNHLAPIRSSLGSLSTSLDRLHHKIHEPYDHLSLLVRRLTFVAQASDLSRRAARFVLVARRLEGQMANLESMKEGDGKVVEEREKDRELAKAALSVAELDGLLRPPVASEDGYEEETAPLPLDSLDFVKATIPMVDQARDSIIQEMETMVVNGLADLNQPLLSSSLQTAHNLRLLPDLVSNLLADLNDAVTLRISKAFDSAAIGREVNGKDGSATTAIKFTARNKANEPTSANQQQWINVLWSRLERVIEDVANCCIKVYTLEKVLRMKKDAVTQVEFLDEVMKTLDEKPSFTFWTTLAKAFETQTKEAARTTAWLQQALSTGYPRLLRLFHDFFAKIAVHTDTVYTREHQSPEAVLVLRSVSTFETLYLTRSTSRMTEAVNSAVTSFLSGRGNPPGPAEGVTIARTVTNELDSARFDPLLVRTVARNASRVLDNLATKIDGALVKDFTATSLIGPNATPAQILNAQLIGCLYHCRYNISFVQEEFSVKVWEIIQPTYNSLETTYKRITDSLDTVIRRECANIISRIHKVDFAKPVDVMSMSMGGSGGSPYMQDLIDKLGFLKNELLGRMSLGEFMREWILNLCKYIIQIFLLHASIAQPLGENGNLKLTGDLTELEMGLASLLSTGQVQGARGVRLERVGDEYLALRAFRPLLFADPPTLANPVETVHLQPLIVLHHLLVRSPLKLPHQIHGWTEVEYVLWVLKHEEREERLGLVENALEAQLLAAEGSGKHGEGEEGRGAVLDEENEWVKLIREVLIHARHEEGSPAG